MMGYVEHVEHEAEEFALADMPTFSVGVLTAVPDSAMESVGDVVIRVCDEFDYLGGSDSWDTLDSLDSRYRARLLLPGERVTITN